MTAECPYCGKESTAERLSVVSVEDQGFYGTLWRCPECGVISDESGNEVHP